MSVCVDRQRMEEWVDKLMCAHVQVYVCTCVHAWANSLVDEFLSD